MDSRLDPLRDLGLERGDAMVLRNAGATLSEDVERSLRMAHESLGVDEVWIVGHTDCVAHGADLDSGARDAARRRAPRATAAPRLQRADAAVRPGDGPGRPRSAERTSSASAAPATIAAPPASSSATAGPATARAAA